MALVVDIDCLECGKRKRVTIGCGKPTPVICHDCNQIKADMARIEHFSGLDGMTIEERLRRIEEQLYDLKFPVRMNELRF